MGSDRFSFEIDAESGEVTWTSPSHSSEVTDDQARTIALFQVGRALDRLAVAIERSESTALTSSETGMTRVLRVAER